MSQSDLGPRTARPLAAALALLLALLLAGCAAPAASTRSDGLSSQSSQVAAASSAPAATGAEPLVIVVVGFSGGDGGADAVAYRDDFDWHAMTFESAEGVSAYYRDQSLGAFAWVPASESSAYGADGNTCVADKKDDGIVHVVLPRGHGHWFSPELSGGQQGAAGGSTDAQAAADRDFDACTVDALRAAAAYIDFSSYDTDGSGTIDSGELGVAVIYAGYDIDGDWMDLLDDAAYPRIQPHAGGPYDIGISRGSAIIPDHAAILGEAIMRVPENRIDDKEVDAGVLEVVPSSISSLAHELGHYLKLPDYYDTTSDETAPWSFWNPGRLSLMDIGCVVRVSDGNGGYILKGAGLDAFSRVRLGWLSSQTVSSPGTYELRADGAEGGKNVLRVETGRKGEYFLIENRQMTGFDAALAGQYEPGQAGGIVVWHVDEAVYDAYATSNQVNLPSHHPALTVQYLMNANSASKPAGGHTLSFNESATPDPGSAFWSSVTAQERFAELGVDALQLWVYGEGDNADDPLSRTYCDIYLNFPDTSADIMHVEISFKQS